MEDLTGFLTSNWKGAFEVAVRWARKNLSRITQDAINYTEPLITARMDARDPTRVPPHQTMTTSQAQDEPQTWDSAWGPLQ